MEILFMLLVAAVSLLLSVALPIAALLRASRLSSEVAALRSRLAAIEEHLRELSASHGRPATTRPRSYLLLCPCRRRSPTRQSRCRRQSAAAMRLDPVPGPPVRPPGS